MSNKLPSIKTLSCISRIDADIILSSHEKSIREHYPDDSGVIYGRGGRSYGREITRRKLKRIDIARRELGIGEYIP